MNPAQSELKEGLLENLQEITNRRGTDIRDRTWLDTNCREKFQSLNQVLLTDREFHRLLDKIVTPVVFSVAKTLRENNAFTHGDGTLLNYALINMKDWCKNTFEVVSQLRINTDNGRHRYDLGLLLINVVPVTQIELKTHGVNPRCAIEQVVELKNELGNRYTVLVVRARQ